MRYHNILSVRSLQLFAEGGDGGTAQGAGVSAADAGLQNPGVTAAAAVPQQKKGRNPLADVKYGIQPETAPQPPVQTAEEPAETPPPDLNAEFNELIQGKYKDQYNATVQDIVRRRVEELDASAKKYDALAPVLQLLGQRYGVDTQNPEALVKALEGDDSLLEKEAMESGVPLDQLKQLRSAQRETERLRSQLKAQQDRENADRLYAQWMRQGEAAKQVYPGFDLRTELKNPQFVQLLSSNIDAKTAYEVLHKDELIPAAMQAAAKQVEEKIAKRIASGQGRPTENGMNSASAAVVKSDVSKLTRKDINEIARRVARGERISFG